MTSIEEVKRVRRRAETIYNRLIKAGFNANQIHNIGVEIRIMADNWEKFADE